MSFFFNDFFGGGMPGGGHFHGHGHGDDSDDEPVDTEKFYKLLGISKSATQQEIKKAYRKKARELHPDKHPNEREKYQALFQEIQAANEILKDPQKRQLYDKYGEKGAKRGGGARTGSSLFEHMFGGSRASHNDHNGQKKSPPIKTALDVTLQDIYCGSSKKIKVHRRVAGKDSRQCPKCHGQGQITQVQRMGPMVLQQRRECPQCGGIGYKLERQEHTIEIHVPIGSRHGESITINGEGNQYPDMIDGDVIIQLRVGKHKIFSRKGADLGMNYSLSLRQALCGYKIKILHVSGKTLMITPKYEYDNNNNDNDNNQTNYKVVQPGSLHVVYTMGLPQRFSPHVKGHLYIVMDVKMPIYNTLSNNKIKMFEKILPNQLSDDDDDNNNNNNDDNEIKQQPPQPQPQPPQPPQNNNNNNKNTNNKQKK
eukprot:307561_1